MPALIDTPEVVEHEEHAFYAEQPPVRQAHPRFWYRVLQYVQRHRVHILHGTPCSSHRPHQRIDTPADLLAREYPNLYIRAYAGV